jgi:predicted permease
MKLWRRKDQSLEDELRDHLDHLTRENVDCGMKPEEARAAALRKLGSPLRVKEDTRAVWGWMWFERLAQDLRHACRMFAKNPGFSAVAVLSLAIGTGANSAMFSVADGLLLRPLPVERPGDVVTVGSSATLASGIAPIRMSYPDFEELRARNRSFESVVAFTMVTTGFAPRAGEAQRLTAVSPVTGSFFQALGIEPALGRAFRPEEDQVPGRDAVVVLDYEYWEAQFRADPSVLGRKVWLAGVEFTVIGVAPKRFTSMYSNLYPPFYVPMMMWPRLLARGAPDPLRARDPRGLSVKARLKPGVSLAQAQQEVSALGAGLAEAHPETNRDRALLVRTEIQSRIEENRFQSITALALLALAVAVLLVACSNVGGLLASRAPVRAREISMRMAIGAARSRLIRQLLTEGVVIALAGAAVGLAVAYVVLQVGRPNAVGSDLPIRTVVEMNQRALIVSMAVALGSVLLFGLIPALKTTRTDLTGVMKSRDAVAGRQRLWGRNILVAGQVTLSLLLLTVAAFVYQIFRINLTAPPGFKTDHLVTMTFDTGITGYSETQARRFFERLLERVRSEPGIRSATVASEAPFSNQIDSHAIFPEGYQLPAGQDGVRMNGTRVEQDYFDTLGVRLVEGRAFRETDDADAPLVGIVNQESASHYWPGQSALGKRFRIGSRNGSWVEIVGVAKNSKYVFIAEPPSEFMYLPWKQHPRLRMTLLAETRGDSAAMVAPLREAARSLDADLPAFDVHTMEEWFAIRAVRVGNALTRLVAALGAMGMGLALVGLYGLMAYAVSRRTREIGIRMAVGAGRGTVLRMVLRRGLALALSGIAVGLVASLAFGRFLAGIFSNTFTVSGSVTTSIGVAAALLGVTLLAAYIPARRASRVDPTVTLRYE